MPLTRRGFLTSALVAGTALVLPSAAYAATDHGGHRVSPATALERLRHGNQRWVSGQTQKLNYAPQGTQPTDGQWPFAAILSCSDSRVDPEDIFDVSPGNIFVVRNAGNVVDEDVLGSLEYAVDHLPVSLIVSMGHSQCGAVGAAQVALETGDLPPKYIRDVVERIMPALRALPPGHTRSEAVAANAQHSSRQIQARSGEVSSRTAEGTLGVVQSTYGLASRRVDFF